MFLKGIFVHTKGYSTSWIDLVDWCGYGANDILDIAEKYFEQEELPEVLYNWADGNIDAGLERRGGANSEELIMWVEKFLEAVDEVIVQLKRIRG